MAVSLQFLGTGAADFSPLLESSLKNKLDQTVRRATSTLINGHILLDCGPHTPEVLGLLGLDPRAVTDIVFTHLHSDHFSADSVRAIAGNRPSPLRLWFREGGDMPDIPGTELHPMRLMQMYEIGELSVTGLPANHEAWPQHLYLEGCGKRLFYGLDGAWMMGDTVRFLQGKKLDCAILDCTVGDYVGDFRIGEHNSIPMLRLLVPGMRTLEILREDSLVVLDHIAHTLHKPHEELAACAEKEGWIAACDGMRLEI